MSLDDIFLGAGWGESQGRTLLASPLSTVSWMLGPLAGGLNSTFFSAYLRFWGTSLLRVWQLAELVARGGGGSCSEMPG